jgi:hypothetical protein
VCSYLNGSFPEYVYKVTLLLLSQNLISKLIDLLSNEIDNPANTLFGAFSEVRYILNKLHALRHILVLVALHLGKKLVENAGELFLDSADVLHAQRVEVADAQSTYRCRPGHLRKHADLPEDLPSRKDVYWDAAYLFFGLIGVDDVRF